MSFKDTGRYRQYIERCSRQTHCHNGHPLTADNVRVQTYERKGRTCVVRSCRACQRSRRRDAQPRHVALS